MARIIPLDLVLLCLAGGSALLFFFTLYYKRKSDRLLALLDEKEFRTRSLSTTYGKISEQWFPLMDNYPYDSRGFRFLGSPVDGVQFEEDRVVFCEFKSNRSTLSPEQRKIKHLVESGQVFWEEYYFRADE